MEMPVDISSDCDCPNCLEGAQSESYSNPCSDRGDDCSLYSRSKKKPMPSPRMQGFLSQCCPIRLERDNKEDSVFLPSEEENSGGVSKKNYLSMSPEDIKRKLKPLKELTIQDLLREFGISGKFHSNSLSLGHFRDQLVIKFRRALYYSGIWLKYVQGYKLEKHFSANYFKRNPGSLHRLVPWLKRELTAVYGDYGYTVKNILGAILHHMTEYDLDSESFIHLLEPYLQQHTHHFLHEFISFVHSPYNMETYDQKAIYQCTPASTWVKNKSIASTSVLPLPEEHFPMTSQHDTKQTKYTKVQWHNEERPQSGFKQFPNGSLKNSKTSLTHHKIPNKIHAWIKDKPESDDHKGTVSTNDMLLNWATPRETCPDVLSCKRNAKEKNKKGINLLPSHVQDLQKNETVTRTFSTPAISNQVQPKKYNLRKRRVLKPGQKKHFQQKEVEKNEYSQSSPKIIQRLPRERSLISCKSRERDPSWSCISDNILSPERNGRNMSSFREKETKCRQSSPFVDHGSHSSRRIQRQSRSTTHRSKSWCVGPRTRSISRESINLSLGVSHGSERFTQNMCCEHSKGKNICGHESIYERTSLTPVQNVKLSSGARKRSNCFSKGESTSQTRSHCNSPTCLQIEKHGFPDKQEIKQKHSFPRGRKTRTLRHSKNKYQCTDIQTSEEVKDELEDLNDRMEMRSLSECAPSCKRQIHIQQNSNLQKHQRAKNEHKRAIVSER